MPPARFEPAIPEIEWPQTHALDRATIGIGTIIVYCNISVMFQQLIYELVKETVRMN